MKKTSTSAQELILRTALLASVAATPMFASSAFAQDQEDSVFEEIVVTARKREESLLDTPTSLSVFGNDTLETLNVSNLDDVGKYVPNLNINRFGVGNPSQAAIFIRGIGLQDHLIVTDPGVGVYVDGVYLGRQMGSNLSLPNIERVEVLRGPQGTLYGRNSIGGAVNIITRQPGDVEEFEISARGGTRARAEFSAYGNFPVTDNFAISVNGAFKRRDGVGRAVNLDNPSKEIGEEQEISGRIAAKWQVNDRLSVLAAFDGQDFEGGQSPYAIEILTPEQLGGLPDGVAFFGTPLLTEADLVDRDDLGTNVPGLEDVSNDAYGVSLTIEYEANDNITTKLLASYRDSSYTGGLDDDDTIFNLSEFPEEGEAEQFSSEFQVNAVFGDWDIVSGLYYFYEDGSVFSGPYTFAPFNVATPADFFRETQTTNSYAVYFNAGYDVSERLKVGVGARYSRDEKDATAFFPGFAGVDEESANFDAITADANITYSLSDTSTVYAQIQRGYQTGGFPPRPFVGGEAAFESFDKQTALNYEVGYKGQVTPNLRVLASAFWTVYNDLALNISVPQAGGFQTIVDNAGKSRSRGFELETQFATDDGFFLNGSVGYLDAEITEVDIAPGESSLITEGDSPALTPKWTASVVGGYTFDLEGGATVTAQADYSYRGEMFGQAVNIEPEILDDRSLFGFNLQYQNANGDWIVDLYGENVFNKVYDQGRLINTFHGFVGRVLSNDRSEFGIRITKKFGG
ncbi:MAG: TonB-dependent receptor [Sphingomonadales bacterium]